MEKEQLESAGRWRESTRRARCTQSRSTIKTAVQVFAQLLLSSLFLAAALFLLPLLLLLSPPPLPSPLLTEKKKESERISRLVPFCFFTRGLSSSRLFSPLFFHSPSFLVLQPLPKTKKTLSPPATGRRASPRRSSSRSPPTSRPEPGSSRPTPASRSSGSTAPCTTRSSTGPSTSDSPPRASAP